MRPQRARGLRLPLGKSLLLLLFLALLCCVSCRTGVPAGQPEPLFTPDRGPEAARGRVSPVYEHWLYRQSLLEQAEAVRAAVPPLALWLRPGDRMDRDRLLTAAPTWAVFSLPDLPKPAARTLEAQLPALARAGIRGVWLRDILEEDTVWLPEGAPSGHRPISLRPAPALGSEEDFRSLTGALQAQGIQSGSPLLSPATGLGPDFMLQARASARQQGLYLLFALPDRLNGLFPGSASAWDCRLLTDAQVRRLREEKVIPGPLRQDAFLPRRAAWALTGEVAGVDGRTRRWVYRTLDTPFQPLLAFPDPSGLARGLLRASALETAGLRRQALSGLSLAGLSGLEPDDGTGDGRAGLSPAPLALADLARTLRRCGGWSLCLDASNPSERALALETADFAVWPDLVPLLREALASGSAAALARELRALLEASPDPSRLAYFSPAGAEAPAPAEPDAGPAELALRVRHLLLSLPLGLPGLAFLEAEVLGEGPQSPGGSALDLLARDALAARAELGLARGKRVRVLHPAEGLLITETYLPGGGRFFTALNCSGRPVRQSVSLPGLQGPLRSLTPTAPDPEQSAPGSCVFSLKARQAAHYLADAPSGRQALQGDLYGHDNPSCHSPGRIPAQRGDGQGA